LAFVVYRHAGSSGSDECMKDLSMDNEVYWRLKEMLMAVAVCCLLSCQADSANAAEAHAPHLQLKATLSELRQYQTGQSLIAVHQFTRYLGENDLTPVEEQMIIDFLNSDATATAKQIVCRNWGPVASDRAVDTLARMLSDPEMFDMALFVLEYIGGESVDEVLLEFLDSADKDEKVALANALGRHRCKKALPKLIELITEPDSDIAGATLAAVGQIGSPEAIETLTRIAEQAHGRLRLLALDALLNCAEESLANGDQGNAISVYRALSSEHFSEETRIAAFRGLIHAATSQKVNLILNALKSNDKGLRRMAISLAQELQGQEITQDLARSLPTLSLKDQIEILRAISERNDPSALEDVMKMTASANPNVRIAAYNTIARIGDETCVIPLAHAAAEDKDVYVAEAAQFSLNSIKGETVDRAILASIPVVDVTIRIPLLRSVCERMITDSVTTLLEAIEDGDWKVRNEAFKAVKITARKKDIPSLIRVLDQTELPSVRKQLALAILAASRKIQDENGKDRSILAQLFAVKTLEAQSELFLVLGKLGSSNSLPVLREALNSPDDGLRQAAIHALAVWPNAEPVGEILKVVRNDPSRLRRILALRACIQLMNRPSGNTPVESVALLAEVEKLADRNEEKKLILEALVNYSCPQALDLANKLASQSALWTDAERVIKKLNMITLVGSPQYTEGLRLGTDADGTYVIQTEDEGDGTLCWHFTRYMYFDVDNDFEILCRCYWHGSPSLEYDSTDKSATLNGAYKFVQKPSYSRNEGIWQRMVWHLEDAKFANRQNDGCDFRFCCLGPNCEVTIAQVRVSKGTVDMPLPTREKRPANQPHPDSSDNYYRRANAYLHLGQFEHALSAYSKAIELNPDNSGYWHFRGKAYQEMKQWDKAVDDLTKAIELDPNNPHHWHVRGWSYLGMQQCDKAVADYSKAIELDPDNPGRWSGRALAYRNARQFEQAINDYTKAIELDPDNPHYWHMRHAIYQETKQWDKAVDDYTKIIELNPEDSHRWHMRGETYLAMKQWEKAVADYSKAIELDPDNPSRWSVRALAYRNAGQFEQAITDYSKTIELNPEDSHRWHLRGVTYLEMKQWDKAVDDLTKAIELDPNNPHYWHMRGETYLAMKQWEKAVADYSKAIELDPDNPGRWSVRALAYRNAGQFEQAITDYTKTIELDPGNSHYWNMRHAIYKETKQWDRAVIEYSKAIERDPDNPKLWEFRGSIHLQMGQWIETISDFAKAIELDPNQSWFWHERGYAYMQLGQWDKVVSDYSSAIKLQPDISENYARRANAYLNLGQFEHALSDFSQLIKLDPNNSRCWETRAWAYYKMEQWDNAIADCSKAVELDSNNWRSLNIRAWAYIRIGQWEKSITDLSKPIQLEPNIWGHWVNRAWMWVEMEHWDNAIADWMKSIELNPDRVNPWYYHALLQLYTGKVKGYRDTCTEMLNHFRQTENPKTSQWVVQTCVLGPNAVEDLDKVVKLSEQLVVSDDKNDQYSNALGAILYRAGRFEEAVENLTKLANAWEETGQYPTLTSPGYTWFFMAMAQHQLGNIDESLKYYNKALKRAEQELLDNPSWNRKITLQLLEAEAESLLRITQKAHQND
jgi:tetratricopeptide (TPR) repeat protein